MLTRSTYIGVQYFNRRDSRTGKPRARECWVAVEAPRIIDDDVFHAVQTQLNARAPMNKPPRLTNSAVLLSGVARCGQCGAAMRSRTGKYGRYWYYVCSRKADIGATACGGAAIAMQTLDDIVTDAVCDQVLDPVRLDTMLNTLAARSTGRRERERAELRRLLAKQRELSGQVTRCIRSRLINVFSSDPRLLIISRHSALVAGGRRIA